MTRIVLPAILSLTSLAATAQTVKVLDSLSYQEWSIAQLCEARDTPQAWAEIKRRDHFSARELRSIEKQQVRSRISEEALICFMGEPQLVSGLAVLSEEEAVDAYTYVINEDESIVVHVKHVGDVSTVLRVLEASAAAYSAPYWSNRYCQGFGCRSDLMPSGCESPVTSSQSTTRCSYGLDRFLATRSRREQMDNPPSMK